MALFHISHRRERTTGGKFSNDWFLGNQGQFERHLAHLAGRPCRLLEIGCYEGQATTWLLKHVATHHKSTVTCIDLGEQDTFWANVATTGKASSVDLRIGASRALLPALEPEFDFIYIDGSHTAIDVLQDAVLSWELAKAGAIIAFDDYLWKGSQELGRSVPRAAIDAFLKIYANNLTVLAKNYQVWVRKNC
jgi:predicted O-methyltransferase YrrM